MWRCRQPQHDYYYLSEVTWGLSPPHPPTGQTPETPSSPVSSFPTIRLRFQRRRWGLSPYLECRFEPRAAAAAAARRPYPAAAPVRGLPAPLSPSREGDSFVVPGAPPRGFAKEPVSPRCVGTPPPAPRPLPLQLPLPGRGQPVVRGTGSALTHVAMVTALTLQFQGANCSSSSSCYGILGEGTSPLGLKLVPMGNLWLIIRSYRNFVTFVRDNEWYCGYMEKKVFIM